MNETQKNAFLGLLSVSRQLAAQLQAEEADMARMLELVDERGALIAALQSSGLAREDIPEELSGAGKEIAALDIAIGARARHLQQSAQERARSGNQASRSISAYAPVPITSEGMYIDRRD